MKPILFSMNTGQLSLLLGLILIVVSFAGFFAVYKAIKSKIIEGTSLVQLIDLGKWIMVSVSLVVISAIISDGFKEREQEIKELDYFDKYKDITLSTEGIEKKWLLAEYFATVSPVGPFKDAWVAYKKTLKPDYDKYETLKNKQLQFSITEADSSNQQALEQKTRSLDSLQSLKFQINEKYKPITITPQSALNGFKVDIFYTADLTEESKPRAEKIYNLLTQKYPSTSFQLKALSKEANAKPGYRIQQNQIRYEPAEADVFKELQEAITDAGILSKEPVAGFPINYVTPNYISVFIRND